jgi:hypothetical protein
LKKNGFFLLTVVFISMIPARKLLNKEKKNNSDGGNWKRNHCWKPVKLPFPEKTFQSTTPGRRRKLKTIITAWLQIDRIDEQSCRHPKLTDEWKNQLDLKERFAILRLHTVRINKTAAFLNYSISVIRNWQNVLTRVSFLWKFFRQSNPNSTG